MHISAVVGVIALALSNGTALAGGGGIRSVPVMIGGERELDACGSTGIVSGLRGGPGSFLAVRRGPGVKFDMVSRLQNGQRLWICETREGWLGVVYGANGQDCGVSSPSARRSAYAGSCASGWVAERFVRNEAG